MKTDNVIEKNFFQAEKLEINVANVANVATLVEMPTENDAENVDIFDIENALEPIDPIEAAKNIADEILQRCKDEPNLLGTSEFKEAMRTLYSDESLKFEYRTKLKKAKPSGVLMSYFDELEKESSSSQSNESTASELITLVTAETELFFDDYADKAFVTATIENVEHTMAIGSKAFIDWLSFTYYNKTKCQSEFGSSASESNIKQACFALAGIAKYDFAKKRAYLRVAQTENAHYIFLSDEKMQVVELTADGWTVLPQSPVKFWKTGAMKSLPIPVSGGDVNELWNFLNIPEKERPLVLAWMLEALRSDSKKPVLAITGVQGTAKSSTHDKIRQLIDPNVVNLRVAPKNREDIFVSAGCNWLVSFENISCLRADMQDAICTLATGGGFAARTLYTNTEETIISVQRPVIINSIPVVVTAQDLADRVIAVELQPIAYKEDKELNAAWEQRKPVIFGALLDLLVKVIVKLPDVVLVNPPRMADFTRLGEAMMQIDGFEAGHFTDLYYENRSRSVTHALSSSPVALAICDMVENHTNPSLIVFRGTMQELLNKLSAENTSGYENFPRTARGLGDVIKRQSPALLISGIQITVGSNVERINGTRGIVVEIRKVLRSKKADEAPFETMQPPFNYLDEERF